MEPIKRVNVYETVAGEIRNYIKLNNLKRGDKLPSEKQLAEILQIGRSSLRESLKFMEGMGLIEVKVGKGVYVKNPNKHFIPIGDITEKEYFFQMLEIRQMIEMKALELAIERATDEDLETMEKALVTLEEVSKRSITATKEDLIFHMSVYKSTKNPMMLQLIEAIGDVFYEPWKGSYKDTGVFFNTLKYHRKLYSAIRDRDVEYGRSVVNELIETMKNELMEFWSD